MNARALLAASVISSFISLPLTAAGQATPVLKDGRPAATVLCYHMVEELGSSRLQVSGETFRQHMRYLAMTGYNVIPLRHLYEYVAGKRATIPQNAVVITIDDGWRSTYTEVYPEMKRRKFPFTVFLYPNIVDQTPIAVSWKEVKEMADAGVDIQSHSLSHPFLSRRRQRSKDDAKYAEWLQRELADSRRIIEKHTGRPVEFLAYPYGDYDSGVATTAGKAGYAAALTCEFGRVKQGSDPLRMKRVVVDQRMDFAEFRRYMGAGTMHMEEVTPLPGKEVDPAAAIVRAKIKDFQSIDPKSVGMALISTGSLTPFAYDARSGAIELVAKSLKGKYHRALVWANDLKTGKRVEFSWTFRLPEPPAPAAAPAVAPAVTAAAAPATTPPVAPHAPQPAAAPQPQPVAPAAMLLPGASTAVQVPRHRK